MVTLKVKRHTVLLDDADYTRLQKEFGEQVNVEVLTGQQRSYAVVRRTRNGKRESIPVARFLMKIVDKKDKVVLFKDKNPLNLVRKNMMVGSKGDAMKGRSASRGGTSKYLGVSFNAARNKWAAHIKPAPDVKNKHLGLFDEEDDAAEAYNSAAKMYHGRLANLNVIE